MAIRRIKVVPYSPDGCTGNAVLTTGPNRREAVWRAFHFSCYPNVKTIWGDNIHQRDSGIPEDVRAAVERHCKKVCTWAALRRRGFER